ncbi:hypothetical protein NKI19_10530 [Mesorhizobium sp. M0751]|uniref:hypothetical protein n=1 Tax=unclassified Mesorhizobium TaxID=325217 RepID=UPI003336AFB5
MTFVLGGSSLEQCVGKNSEGWTLELRAERFDLADFAVTMSKWKNEHALSDGSAAHNHLPPFDGTNISNKWKPLLDFRRTACQLRTRSASKQHRAFPTGQLRHTVLAGSLGGDLTKGTCLRRRSAEKS